MIHMTELSIDIETYSSVDLIKSGVYAYVDAPDFEILLFAYAFDDEDVQIADIAQGEKLPYDVMSALTDENIIKTAYNANFERTCISRYFNMDLPVSQWRCSSIQALELGLLSGLANVAEALGLPQQKDKRGKALIDYFSKPAKAKISDECNGQVSLYEKSNVFRHLPSDAPDKWQIFKEYCIQDVEVERAIKKKLLKFPINDREQRLWEHDQRINERGVRVDLPFVEKAIEYNNQYGKICYDEAKKLTGLENPKSVAQLKKWLETETGETIDSLNKEKIKELIASDVSLKAKRVLFLRSMLAKTSVSKYEAMKRSVCSDGRIRGLLQFYGANRTGRWCLTGDHEVLTDKGWCRLDKWRGGKIACWNPVGENVSFQTAKQLQFPYDGIMYEYSDARIAQKSTPDHRMYVKKRYGGNWQIDTVENMKNYRPSIPFTGYRRNNPGMEHSHLRVLVMVQADGYYTEDGSIRLKFAKLRKVDRCKELLRAADITYSINEYYDRGKKRYNFTIYSRHIPLWLRMFQDKTFGTWLFDESADVFFDEIVHWDGYRSAKNSIQYTTCNKTNADIVQAFAHITGRCATLKVKERSKEHPNWNDAYTVDIWLTPKNCHEIRNKPIENDFKGFVYCAETPTGFFLIRRNGKVWVTGNSGRLVQVQNIPQNHLSDLDYARDNVKNGDFETFEMLFGNVPGTLSELIRTALIPSDGRRFIVSDFSAIEARVLSYLADENWRLEVFRTHGKIYEASASQMFHVPVESIHKGDPLRQKGKIAELALGYGGSVGAMINMGALKMGLEESELQPIVDRWRNSNPAITAFWKTVENAAFDAINGKPAKIKHGISFMKETGILFIGLPSGRRIAYVKPQIGVNKFDRPAITYMGMNQTSNKWERLETWGGKLTENIIQAFARDCLAESVIRLEQRGFEVNFHVHDEVILDVPDGVSSADEVSSIMCEPIEWAPGLPLNADGYECNFYMKD